MRALLVLSMSIAAIASPLLLAPANNERTSAGSGAYFCEYPKDVTVAGRTASTPTICVPFP